MKRTTMAIGTLLVLAVLLIGVLSLLRSRAQSGEHPAIVDIRHVISAEVAYSSLNGGFFGPLSCLEKPATCIPGHSGNHPFIDPTVASLATKNGYARRFHPGPTVTPEEAARARASPSSFRDFAYVAVPEQAGKRGFCGEASGLICWTMNGIMPAIKNGRCPEIGCQILR